MKLPGILDKLTPPIKNREEPFIALEITTATLKAAIWRMKQGTVELLGVAQQEYKGGWEEVIKKADETITEAEKNLPEGQTTQKVIFGLPNHWIEEGKIKSERLNDLKKLSDDLDLKPLGFVIISEAIGNFLQKQEGSPLTTILIGIEQSEITVSLIRGGRMDGITVRPRTEKIIDDVTNALTEFTHVEVLPSRILLFDSNNNLETIKQELIAFPWQSKGSFLHFPKIEILEPTTDIKAVALAGGMELGQVIDIHLEEETTGEVKSVETLGFIKEKDIIEETPLPSCEEAKTEELPEQEEITEEELLARKQKPRFSFKFPKITLPPIKIPFPKVTVGRPKILIAATICMISALFLVTFAVYWYLPKAWVTLLVDSKTLEEEKEITGDPKATVTDITSKTIPLNIIEISESGTKTATTTGKKTIGEKAHGEVTIYNRTNNEKTFKAGELIISTNNLKFTIDNDVTVASQSVTKTGATFGTTKVKTTATQIGVDGNLPAGTDFSFKDYPQTSYTTSNDNAFSGGSSKEVTVVSKDDQNKLLESLANELKEKVKNEIPDKVSGETTFINQSFETQIIKKTFDKEEGTQGTNVTLSLELKIKIPTYKSEDLKDILTKYFEANTPDGYDFKASDVTIQSQLKEVKKDGKIIFSAHFKANLLPKINTEEIRRNITGKNLKLVEDYFRGLTTIAGYEITIKPKLPLLTNSLPNISRNISIAVATRK